jgi:competence protein ComEA
LTHLAIRISQAALALAVLASLIGGVVLVVRASTSGGGIEIILPTTTVVSPVDMKVYVTGAVLNPGLYDVVEGSRLADVIEAAGGATEDADLTAINLAVRVSDEQQWHIPVVGDAASRTSAQTMPLSPPTGAGKIDLNLATLEELMSLPGIREAKAQAIVSYIEANGPFPDVDAVLGVTGIGPITLSDIRDLVEVR